jgi:LPXTG-site transpeptidase (sortase) family protein
MLKVILRLTGNLLLAGSALGAIGLAVLVLLPEQAPTPAPGLSVASAQTLRLAQRAGQTVTGTAGYAIDGPGGNAGRAAQASVPAAARLNATAELTRASELNQPHEPRPVTHLDIAAIDLSTDVVRAALLEREGGVTWDVPAFVVGHAEMTAGAGEPGNAVLLGHVTSVHSGNVFHDLERVKVGDLVHIVADATVFDYRVVSTSRVPRTDASVLAQGDVPAISLITCTGLWLPGLWDYTERLVVRAELVYSQ